MSLWQCRRPSLFLSCVCAEIKMSQLVTQLWLMRNILYYIITVFTHRTSDRNAHILNVLLFVFLWLVCLLHFKSPLLSAPVLLPRT